MRVDDIFPPEVIDEDLKKWLGGAVAAGTLAALPMGVTSNIPKQTNYEVSIAQNMRRDISIMAQTMWGEARNHGEKGMLAVGSVIKNRADSDRGLTFGNGIRGVALKRKQFSCWNPGDPNREKIEQMKVIDRAIKFQQSPVEDMTFEDWFEKFSKSPDMGEYEAWKEAYALAEKILKGQIADPTHGALFYHTTGVFPKWARNAEPIAKVANHVFYSKVN